MTNAEVVFKELERQGLHAATLSVVNDRLFIKGAAEIDCNALVKAIKAARFALPCPLDRGLGGSGLPESLSVVPNIPWSMMTIEQLEEEKAYWESVSQQNLGFVSSSVSARFVQSCKTWIEKRRADLAYSKPIGTTSLAAH